MSKIRLIFVNEEQKQSYEKFMKECDEEFQKLILWGEKTPSVLDTNESINDEKI